MNRSCMITAVATMIGFTALCSAAEKPVELPRDMAKLLTDAKEDLAKDQPQKAIDRLNAFKGKDHALRHLLLGHAHAAQSNLEKAAEEYRSALAMDKTLHHAGIALAQVLAQREKWAAAVEMFGKYTDIEKCDVQQLFLYALCAQRLEDNRLCGLLVRKGVVRFPADDRFRKLDLAILIDEKNYAEADRSVRLLLKKRPADGELWKQLAFVRGEMKNDIDQLAALEANLLCNPDKPDCRKQYITALLASGDWLTATKYGQTLMNGGKTVDIETMDLLIRAADTGECDKLLEKWLAMIGEKKRTRSMRLAAVRLSLRQGKTPEARKALDGLIESGDTDASVFLWAGHLAETDRDFPRAETYYKQAGNLKGSSSRIAVLYLARLYYRTDRLEKAGRLVRNYLNTYAEDSSARALLSLIDSRIK